MGDAGGGVAGRVDDDVQAVGRDQRKRIVANVGAAALQRRGERARTALILLPAGARQRGLGPGRIEIGHRHDMEAGCAPRLGEEHGAELAGADQSDPHALSVPFAIREHPMKVHGALL